MGIIKMIWRSGMSSGCPRFGQVPVHLGTLIKWYFLSISINLKKLHGGYKQKKAYFERNNNQPSIKFSEGKQT